MIKDLIGNLAKKMGYRITKNSTQQPTAQTVKTTENKEELLTVFYGNLKSSNFPLKFVVDIGANTGTWTRELLKNFPDVQVLMIEPQERLSSNFQDLLLQPKINYLPVGAGNKNDILKFTIHDRDDSCSFIYSEEEAEKMGYEQIEVPIKTLNSIIKENNYPFPDMIKIDAEGLDLEVIEGASDFYDKTEIFLVEASVCNGTYKNTVSEVVNLMDKCGFQMYEITDLNRPFPKSPVLWLIEIAFVRKNGFLLNNLNISV